MKKALMQNIKQTGQEQIMEQFKAKKQNIEIFYPDGRKDFAFEDIKGYSLNGPYLVVQLHNDTQYIYPMSAISSLKLSVTE